MAATLLSLSLLAGSMVSALPTKIPRQEQGKRGLPFNTPELLNLFPISSSTFSWCYNWGPSFNPPQGLEFVPLLHGNQPEFTNGWIEKLENAAPKAVFSFNEPDQCGKDSGGSCITDVKVAADAHRQYISDPIKNNPKLKNIRAGSPSVTNGEAPKGRDYLERFLAQCGDCRIDFLNAHWYASATKNPYYDPLLKFQEDINAIRRLKPELKVWVTEWGFDAGTDEEKTEQMKRIIEWLEAPDQDWIERHAYQWAAPGYLVNSAGNALSVLGKTYSEA